MSKKPPWMDWVYGRDHAAPAQDHSVFQVRLSLWLLLSASLFNWALLVWIYFAERPVDPQLVPVMRVFGGVTLLAWWWLRGHPQHCMAIAWGFLAVALAQNTAMWFWALGDELRVLWFVVNVPAVYVVLGRRVGAAVTGLTVGWLLWANPWNPQPLSPTALFTLVAVLLYLAVFFHIYVDRSLSYYEGMRELNTRLQQMATHDALTGLLNAREFAVRAEHLLRLAVRNGQPCALVFVDLDHFKQVNDLHGHAAGDTVLREVAQALTTPLRGTDLLGRLGGEEFAVFLPGTDLDGARQLAEMLRTSVAAAAPVVAEHTPLHVTASVGVASQQGGTRPLSHLQQRADAAMYRAKAEGRNRVALAPPEAEPVPTIGG